MRHALCILGFLLAFVHTSAQEVLKNSEQVKGFQRISQERVFLHLNTSLLLTGEYLYYKLYCFKVTEGDLSDISKVAYIELVGKEDKQVFKHKIRLEEGQGYGDFFIPTSVPSGSYKLLGYTHWMRNGSLSDFFQADITIINPYQSDQTGIQVANSVTTDSISDYRMNVSSTTRNDLNNLSNSGPLELSLLKSTFKKRTKVSFMLKGKNKILNVGGDYSISVRKKDSLQGSIPPRSFELIKPNNHIEIGYKQGQGQNVYLPELRGELFCGKVEAVNNDYRLNNLKVAVSLPGEHSFFDVVVTNSSGRFCFNIPGDYSGEQMVFQVISDHPERYLVSLRRRDQLDYGKLRFDQVDINSSLKNEILKRSIHNQIENSYFQFRPDSIASKSVKQLFDNKERKEFLLDDFTRFKTFKEVILEIVKNVSAQRIGKDDYVIKVKGYDYAARSELLPLIVLDGCIVQDHNALLQYDARTIEKITVLQHKLVFGPEVFLGVLLIETKNGNGYELLQNNSRASVTTIFKPQSRKNYFVQNHQQGGSNSRLPDDRLQLFWMPKFRLDSTIQAIDFYTSDVAGEFEIQIEGFTDENIPVSIRKSIFVE